ncbi:hypothetical protein KKA14_04835 [bacterium]|nr:hypothetical protein [bacterium]
MAGTCLFFYRESQDPTSVELLEYNLNVWTVNIEEKIHVNPPSLYEGYSIGIRFSRLTEKVSPSFLKKTRKSGLNDLTKEKRFFMMSSFPNPIKILRISRQDGNHKTCLDAFPKGLNLTANRQCLPCSNSLFFILGVNTVGNNSCGKSKLVGPMGDILAEASDAREEVLLGAVDIQSLYWAPYENRYLEDYRTRLIPGGSTVSTPII